MQHNTVQDTCQYHCTNYAVMNALKRSLPMHLQNYKIVKPALNCMHVGLPIALMHGCAFTVIGLIHVQCTVLVTKIVEIFSFSRISPDANYIFRISIYTMHFCIT